MEVGRSVKDLARLVRVSLIGGRHELMFWREPGADEAYAAGDTGVPERLVIDGITAGRILVVGEISKSRGRRREAWSQVLEPYRRRIVDCKWRSSTPREPSSIRDSLPVMQLAVYREAEGSHGHKFVRAAGKPSRLTIYLGTRDQLVALGVISSDKQVMARLRR